MTVCGEGQQRSPVNENEQASLRSLRRGVYVKRDISAGELITIEDVYFAFPPQSGQFTANDWSKYATLTCTSPIQADQGLHPENCEMHSSRLQVLKIVQRVKAFLEKSKVVVPGQADLEISHHYGLEKFEETGLTMITVVNREYCKSFW